MQVSYETKEKERSQILLSITVGKKEVKKEYDKLIQDAQKNAELKGFRKGKVPVSILENKYKQGFLAESANKVIDKAFQEVIEKVEKKPIAYASPKMENFELPVLDKDYKFELIYDTYPSFEIGNYKNVEVIKDEVKITNDDVENELEKAVKDFTTIEPKEGKIEDNDIASIDYTVFEDDNEFYKKENEHIYMNKDYDMFKLSKDLLGLNKGDKKEFEKSFSKDEIEKIAGKTLKIYLEIKEVKKEVRPELNEDLVKQIDESCKTVDELKKKINDNLKKYTDNTIKQQSLNIILDKLVDSFKGDIPDSMIEQQTEMYYKEFVNKIGGDEKRAENLLKMDKLTKETYKERFKENAIKEIKKGLILREVVTKENIKAGEEDINKLVEPIAKQYKMKIEDFLKMYKDSGKMSIFENEVETQMALDFLYDNAKIKKGKKISIKDLSGKANS